MNQTSKPYHPLHLNGALVGWTLPDLNKIDERNMRKTEVDKMTALLHAMSDPHYRAEDEELHRYGQAIVRNVYDNRLDAPLIKKSSEPKTEIPAFLYNPTEEQRAKVLYIEPHIPRSVSTKANRDKVRRGLTDLVENITGPVYSSQDLQNRAQILNLIANYHENQRREQQPVQIPIHDSVQVTDYLKNEQENPNTAEKRVIIREIDGSDRPKSGIYEIC